MATGRPPKVERNNKMIQRIKAGESYEQVAEEFGIKVASAKQIVRRHAPDVYEQNKSANGRPKKPVTDEEAVLIRQAVENPYVSMAKLVEGTETTAQRLRTLVKRHDPDGFETRRIALAERAAQRREEKEFTPFNCKTCGALVGEAGRREYCSDLHWIAYNKLSYHLNKKDVKRLNRNSQAFKYAIEAARSGWPLFDELPTVLQNQVKEEIVDSVQAA